MEIDKAKLENVLEEHHYNGVSIPEAMKDPIRNYLIKGEINVFLKAILENSFSAVSRHNLGKYSADEIMAIYSLFQVYYAFATGSWAVVSSYSYIQKNKSDSSSYFN